MGKTLFANLIVLTKGIVTMAVVSVFLGILASTVKKVSSFDKMGFSFVLQTDLVKNDPAGLRAGPES